MNRPGVPSMNAPVRSVKPAGSMTPEQLDQAAALILTENQDLKRELAEMRKTTSADFITKIVKVAVDETTRILKDRVRELENMVADLKLRQHERDWRDPSYQIKYGQFQQPPTKPQYDWQSTTPQNITMADIQKMMETIPPMPSEDEIRKLIEEHARRKRK